MLKEKNAVLRRAEQAFDLALTAAAFGIAYYTRGLWDGVLVPLLPFSDYVFLLYIIIPLWALLLRMNGAYESIRTKSLFKALWPVVKSSSTGVIVLMTVLYSFKLEYISRALVMLFFLTNIALLCASRTLLFAFIHYIRRKGYNFRTVLVVGTDERAFAFARVLESRKEWGVRVVGFVEHEEGAHRRPGLKVLGTLKGLGDVITGLQVDEVVFVVPRKMLDGIEEAILICEKVGIKASIAADFYPHTIAKTTIEEFEGWPLLAFNPTYRMERDAYLKRAADIAFSLAGLAATFPLFLFAMIAIKVTSPGPVFFRQTRCGLNGRRFDLLKFRTMVRDAEGMKEKIRHLNEMSGPVFKAKDDPRITKVGRILRKYSIDELPQLINVLKGDMSIVGPRPPLPSEVDKYDIWQRRRLSVRPGITCFWQVSGRNNIDFDDWMRLDLQYIDNWSFKEDMKIILKTIPAVLRGTGM